MNLIFFYERFLLVEYRTEKCTHRFSHHTRRATPSVALLYGVKSAIHTTTIHMAEPPVVSGLPLMCVVRCSLEAPWDDIPVEGVAQHVTARQVEKSKTSL